MRSFPSSPRKMGNHAGSCWKKLWSTIFDRWCHRRERCVRRLWDTFGAQRIRIRNFTNFSPEGSRFLYPTVAEALRMHWQLIHEFGGISGVRDRGLLEVAIFRPQSGYYDDL